MKFLRFEGGSFYILLEHTEEVFVVFEGKGEIHESIYPKDAFSDFEIKHYSVSTKEAYLRLGKEKIMELRNVL
jgi:hypothetical protein